MPYDQVMPKFKRGALKSGGSGKTVTNPKQAVAIMMSEKKKAGEGKKEYQAHAEGGDVQADDPDKKETASLPSPSGSRANMVFRPSIRQKAEGVSKSLEKMEGPNVYSSPEDYKPPSKSAYKHGGSVKPSTTHQMANNLVETAVNPTEKMKLAKGGTVEKKAPWRRW